MFAKFPTSACLALVFLLGAGLASAQQTFHRTLIVDKSGNWDHITIQAAINDNRIGDDPEDRWTILIYAGEYTENVALHGFKENVDLVGIDRDAVIIAPSSGDGITITSGTETARNNSIRNLTIKTTSGHGIEIIKGGTPAPKDIIIENVTIEADGTGNQGISASEVEDLRVANTKIKTANGHGIEFIKPAGGSTPRNIVLHDLSIRSAGRDKYAIRAPGAKGVPREQRVRVSDLVLYGESGASNPRRAARKP